MRRFILLATACFAVGGFAAGCIEDSTSGPDPEPSAEPEPSAQPEPSPPEPSPPEPSPPEPDVMPEPEPEPPIRVPAKHRPAPIDCDDARGPGATPEEGGAPVDCLTDDDCPDGDNGRCTGNGHDGWYCTYDRCFADADCDGVCQCGGGFRSDHNVCLGGDCRVDADCGAAGFCSPSFGDCGAYTGVNAYYCHTSDDTCIDDADCEGEPQFGFDPYCAF
ncbi:MAG: hypothetical protein ACI9U2_003073, partial [Bradymonadia bacterium]